MTSPIEWVKGYQERGLGPTPHTQSARYSLKALAEKGLLTYSEVNTMLFKADLQDFSWHIIWNDDTDTPDDALAERIGNVDGYAVFIHGWTGSHAIWETLPGEVINRNLNLVSIAVDHNGFGGSAFADRTPEYDECSPVGAMRALENWFAILKLRRQLGDPKPKTVNFVGHSMGGAALFFLNEADWRMGEQTRTALAPALLLHDEIGRNFFTTLGLGIGLVGRLQFLETVERLVSPLVLDTLTDGASQAVKDEHGRIYQATLRSVTARTLAAMGTIKDHPISKQWDFMQVFLGHKDVLVGLGPMMDLLNELTFNVDQVRVMMGTHYMFSVGDDWARVHAQNHTIILDSILNVHARAFQKQHHG